jgi:N-acetylneuraminic acid mutarotase
MTSPLNSMTWKTLTPPPLPRAGTPVTAIDGTLVVSGGTYWQDGVKYFASRADRYDPATDTWTALPSLPGGLGDAPAIVFGGRVRIFGGGTTGPGGTTTWVLGENGWSEDAALRLPASRRSSVAAVVGDRVFLLGGLSGNGTEFGTATSTVWAARATGGWTPCAPLPGPVRFNAAVGVVGGRILLAGGCTPDGGAVRNLDDVLAYDPVTDRWSELARLPLALRGAWGVAVGDRLLVLGGYSDRFLTDIFAVSGADGTVERVGDLPEGLADARFCAVGGRIYGVTGENGIKKRFPGLIMAEL